MVASAILSINFPALGSLFDIMDMVDLIGTLGEAAESSIIKTSIITAKDRTSSTIADAIAEAVASGQSLTSLGQDLQTHMRDGKPATPAKPGKLTIANRGLRGKGSYPARRTARTELSAARARVTLLGADAAGDLVQWTLSPRHPEADSCDAHATADLFGFGPGVYPPRLAPRMPEHPFCLCIYRRVSPTAAQKAAMQRMADHPSFETFAADLRKPLGSKERAATFPDAYPQKLDDPRGEIIVGTEEVEGATRDDSVAMIKAMDEANEAGLLKDTYGAELVRGKDGKIHATVIVESPDARHAAFIPKEGGDRVTVRFVAKNELGYADNLSDNISGKYGINGKAVGRDSTKPDAFRKRANELSKPTVSAPVIPQIVDPLNAPGHRSSNTIIRERRAIRDERARLNRELKAGRIDQATLDEYDRVNNPILARTEKERDAALKAEKELGIDVEKRTINGVAVPEGTTAADFINPPPIPDPMPPDPIKPPSPPLDPVVEKQAKKLQLQDELTKQNDLEADAFRRFNIGETTLDEYEEVLRKTQELRKQILKEISGIENEIAALTGIKTEFQLLVEARNNKIAATKLKKEQKKVDHIIADTRNQSVRDRILKGFNKPKDAIEVGRLVRQRIDAMVDARKYPGWVSNIERDIADLKSEFDAALRTLQVQPSTATQMGKYNTARRVVRENGDKIRVLQGQLADARFERMEDVLKEIRSFGRKGAKKASYDVAGAPAEAVRSLLKAEEYYPTSWIQQSDKGKMVTNVQERGDYRRGGSDGIAKINLSGHGSRQEVTAIHEYAHRMQDKVPGISQFEQQFSRQRNKNEQLLYLYGPQAHSPVTGKLRPDEEVYYKDQWPDAYMGKDYGYDPRFDGVEITTVMNQWRSSYDYDRHKFWQDDDLADFTLGILAGVP